MVTLALHAMNTRFELVLVGDDDSRLTGAGEEAFDELLRVEAALSAYSASSDLYQINAAPLHTPTQICGLTSAFLRHCEQLFLATDGAFDPTLGTGWPTLTIDTDGRTVTRTQENTRLDPGAIGKGFGLDRAAELLIESGTTTFLLHGGTSSVLGVGQDWRIALPDGTTVQLNGNALGVSAPGPRQHVVDPRTGLPATSLAWTAVVAETATEADALSTALLVLGKPGIAVLQDRFPTAQFFAGETPPDAEG